LRWRQNRVENKPSERPASSAELRPGWDGVVDEYAELFYMRVGRFSFRQRWIDREVSPSLTAVAVLLIAFGGFVLGFVLGFVAGRADVLSFPLYAGGGGLASGLGEDEVVSMAVSVPVSVFGCELRATECCNQSLG
jgi:hypothetical protein